MAQNKKKHEVILTEYSNTVIITDYILRWLSLGLHRIISGNEGTHLGYFFTFQILITFFTLGYSWYREYRFRKSIDPEAKEDENSDDVINYWMKSFTDPPLYETLGSSMSVIVRVFLLITFCLMVVQVVSNIQNFDLKTLMSYSDRPSGIGVAFTLTFFLYGAFLLYISSNSVPSISNERIKANLTKNIKKSPQTVEQMLDDQAHEIDADNISSETIVDANDIAIVEMEGEIRNLQNRVEAYILESVMFGALTFSGFLTLLASDKDRLDYELMLIFGDSIKRILIDILLLKFDFSNPAYQIFMDASDDRRFLVVWIMFVTLLSSMFFLLVIASRLKFSQIIENVDNSIRLARAYNDKEEEVFMLHLEFEDKARLKNRLEVLSKKIALQITMATDLLKEVKPIIYYMSIFRNLGVIFFLGIIIIGLLFYSQVLALMVACLSFLVYVYKRIDDWYRRNRLKRIIQQNLDVQYLEGR
ncbi:MAG: hypothetical protein MUE81_12555 [Thermoflexibacter sp.]|nr:hypothetical protein [Thermoflexibacter sp.]